MPSTNQRAPNQRYEPEFELEAKHGEDPARFLECGIELAKARIRGITDIDLLAAYSRVEGERQDRREVHAAINRRISALQND